VGGTGDEQTYLEVAARSRRARRTRSPARVRATDPADLPATPFDLTDFGAVNAIFIDRADGTMVGSETRAASASRARSTRAPPVRRRSPFRLLARLLRAAGEQEVGGRR